MKRGLKITECTETQRPLKAVPLTMCLMIMK